MCEAPAIQNTDRNMSQVWPDLTALRRVPPSQRLRLFRRLTAVVCAMGLTPWDLSTSKPWICGLLAIVILLNGSTLRLVGQMKFGPCLPFLMAIVWGGCAVMVTVLSHSARFADLAVLSQLLARRGWPCQHRSMAPIEYGLCCSRHVYSWLDAGRLRQYL